MGTLPPPDTDVLGFYKLIPEWHVLYWCERRQEWHRRCDKNGEPFSAPDFWTPLPDHSVFTTN